MKTQKKVLFVTHGFALGGAEAMLVQIINRTKTYRIQPFVVSLAEKGPMEERITEDVPIIHVPRKWRYDLRPSAVIASIAIEGGIESVFSIDFFCDFFVSLAIHKIPWKVSRFISVHTTQPRSAKAYLQTLISTMSLANHVRYLHISSSVRCSFASMVR